MINQSGKNILLNNIRDDNLFYNNYECLFS